jgi:hypothetical protein
VTMYLETQWVADVLADAAAAGQPWAATNISLTRLSLPWGQSFSSDPK